MRSSWVYNVIMKKLFGSKFLFILALILYIVSRTLLSKLDTTRLSGAIFIGILGVLPFIVLIFAIIQVLREKDVNKRKPKRYINPINLNVFHNNFPNLMIPKKKPKNKSKKPKMLNTEPLANIILRKIKAYYEELGQRNKSYR